MTKICFLDTETTGLDPDIHEVWEVGCIVREWKMAEIEGPGTWEDKEFHWFLPLFNFKNADPFALDIGKFWERYVWPDPQQYTIDYMSEWCRMWMQMTRGATIVGAVPNFDVERLDLLCKRYGYRMFNHYHLVDVENLVAGKTQMPPPWKSQDLYECFDYIPEEKDRHTALGDARSCRDIYDMVFGNAG